MFELIQEVHNIESPRGFILTYIVPITKTNSLVINIGYSSKGQMLNLEEDGS